MHGLLDDMLLALDACAARRRANAVLQDAAAPAEEKLAALKQDLVAHRRWARVAKTGGVA